MSDKEDAPNGAICYGEISTADYLESVLDNNVPVGKIEVSTDIPVREKIAFLRGLASEMNLNIRETNALISGLTSDSIQKYVNSDEYDPRFKWTAEMSIDGISYMIETRCSTEEALHYVKTKHDKDDLWLGETRNKTIPRRIRVNSIDTIEEVHSDTIDYLKEVAQYRRRKILKARSPSSQFNEISDVITVADRVDELYNIVQEQGNEISHLKSEMSELRIRVQISEQNIKLVGEAANVKTAQLKEEILKLKDFYTIEQIAAMLEISDRRVKYLLYGK